MDLPRQPHDASASSKRPHLALVSVCAAVLALALATSSPAAVQADTAAMAPKVQQPANESGPGSSESMKAAMREAIPAGGAAMGESSPQKAATEEAAAPFRTQTEDTGRVTAQAFDPGHWRPSFGVAGQDVSAYQGTVDWQGQWNQGSRFAYVKATEGNYYLNEQFSQQYNGSRAVGMLRGSYHFAIPNWSSGADQARYFVANGGAWTADGSTLPPVLDIEYNPYAGRTINGFNFGDTCYNMAGSKMVAWIAEFGNTVRSLTGRYPVIYTTTDWWKRCTGSSASFGKYPLWIAAYPSAPSSSPGALPPGWSNYSFWQYSSTGPFAGDSNIWNGDFASLRRFASVADATVPTPSIPSEATVVAADAAGALWAYPATGTGSLAGRRQIGQGWTGLRSMKAVDWNSDNVLDVVAQWNSGKVNVYLGAPGGGFSAGPVLASAGWEDYQLSIGHWITGSRYPQIISRDAAGGLRLWSHNSGTSLSGSSQIGQGWAGLNVTMVDFDGDGHQDLLAQDAGGALRLFRSNGVGGFISEARRTVGNGWNMMTSVSVSNGFTGYGSTGLMARSADGSLRHYPLTGTGSWGQPFDVGNGWNGYLISGGETVNVDPGTPTAPANPSIQTAADVVTVDPAGNLYRRSANAGTLGAASKIGTGFTGLASVHVTDWNGDGIQDLATLSTSGILGIHAGLSGGGFAAETILESGLSGADVTFGPWLEASKFPGLLIRTSDGTVRFHANTSGGALAPATVLSAGFARTDVSMADADGDGNQDIVAVDYLGRMSLYRSDGTGKFIAETRKQIAAGWNTMNSISPVRDFTATGSNGLLARDRTGQLSYHPLAAGTLGAKSVLPSGWNGLLISGSGLLVPERAITSTTDVLTVDSSGGLWNRPAGNSSLGSAYQIGLGWSGMRSLHIVDWNSDAVADVLAQKPDGTLSVYPGSAAGGFAAPFRVAAGGFTEGALVTGKWVSGSRYPGLVGYGADGVLYYWANPTGRTLSAPIRIGTGWSGLKIAMIDFDSDGRQDLLAVDSAGAMRLYRSNGTTRFIPEARKTVGTGWQSFRQYSAAANFAGSGSKGILAVQPTGQLNYYPVVAGSRWGAAFTAGTLGTASIVSSTSAG